MANKHRSRTSRNEAKRDGRKGTRQQASGPATRSQFPRESLVAEAATVAWMLAAFASLVAEILAAGCWMAVASGSSDHDLGRGIASLATLIAAVAGTVTLVLTAAASRLRRVAPPTEIVYGAVAIGLLPWLGIGIAILGRQMR